MSQSIMTSISTHYPIKACVSKLENSNPFNILFNYIPCIILILFEMKQIVLSDYDFPMVNPHAKAMFIYIKLYRIYELSNQISLTARATLIYCFNNLMLVLANRLGITSNYQHKYHLLTISGVMISNKKVSQCSHATHHIRP